MDGNTYILVHRFTHQTVHNELAELAAIVTVDGVCQMDNHFKVVHVYVPVRMIREQTERAMSILLSRDIFIIYKRIMRNTVADETKSEPLYVSIDLIASHRAFSFSRSS